MCAWLARLPLAFGWNPAPRSILSMPSTSSTLRPEWRQRTQADIRSSLRELQSSAALAAFMGVQPKSLNYYAYGPDKASLYSEFTIKKRTGGHRVIKQPNPKLKYLQRLVHELMRAIYGPPRSVHGFVEGKSVITHALQHANRKYLL